MWGVVHKLQSVQNKKNWVLDVKVAPDDVLVCNNSSTNSLSFLDCESLKECWSYSPHTDVITDYHFQQHIVLSAGRDGTLCTHDRRAGKRGPVFRFAAGGGPVQSCASHGTMVVGAQGSCIWIYDMRSGRVVCKLEDSHSEDVTHVRLNGTQLLSCGTDGLCCIFENLGNVPEDDALVAVMNEETALSSCGWLKENIWCVSDLQAVSVYEWKDGNRVFHANVRERFQAWNVLQVLEGGMMSLAQKDGGVCVVSGDGTGVALLQGGHNGIVRGICETKNQKYCTGGEDGFVCLWGKGTVARETDEGRKAPSQKQWKVRGFEY